jgi:hypothetical protein
MQRCSGIPPALTHKNNGQFVPFVRTGFRAASKLACLVFTRGAPAASEGASGPISLLSL